MKYLVTSALPYANGPIHIGHLVEHVQTNIFIRALRMARMDVLYVCGADSHGTPIELSALKANLKPEDFVKNWQEEHERSLKHFSIEFDNGYGTTHSVEHEKHTNDFYNAIKSSGKITRANVDQYFDAKLNRFLSDRFIVGICPYCKVSNQNGDSCNSCNKTYSSTDLLEPKSKLSDTTPVIKQSEHLFFSLSSFKAFLTEWTSKKDVLSEPVKNYLQKWLKELIDWDISRDAPYFGIPIPGEKDKFFYVWIDAPIGYISISELAAKARGLTLEDYWKDPKTKIIHFIGKDIVYFHTLFWPAMLKAAGYNLPSKVVVHGFLTVNGVKMSKSRGTFVTADDWAESLGEDGISGLRYYIACKLNNNINDIDLNPKDFVGRVNADLVNNIVNLISRTSKLLGNVFNNELSDMNYSLDANIISEVQQLYGTLETLYCSLRFDEAVSIIAKIGSIGNKYIQDNKPWDLVDTDPERAHRVLTTALWIGKVGIGALYPVVPELTDKAYKILNLFNKCSFDNIATTFIKGHKINKYEPISNRLRLERVQKLIAK